MEQMRTQNIKLWTDVVDCREKELQASNRRHFTCYPSDQLVPPTETPALMRRLVTNEIY